jgi:hypothetical protein
MIAITTMAYRRPACLKRSLESIAKQQHVDLNSYRLFINIEHGADEYIEPMCNRFTAIDTDIKVQKQKQGINRNACDVVDRAYKKVDWLIYLEEDIIISPDTFSMVEWFIEQELDDVALLSFFNRKSDKIGDVRALKTARRFPMWGFAMHKKKWNEVGKTSWTSGGDGMWDNKMARYIRKNTNYKALIPETSRSYNIGESGEHMDNNKWQKIVGNVKFYTDMTNKPLNYFVLQ